MRPRVKVIFYVHLIIAAYCIMCGMLDIFGHYRAWLIPSAPVFYALIASSVVLPIVATASVFGSQTKNPLLVIGAHVVLGLVQFFFGLLPLIS